MRPTELFASFAQQRRNAAFFALLPTVLAPTVLLLTALAFAAVPAAAQPGVGGGGAGVTLFADAGFRGASQRFTADDPYLRGSRFGQDRASSIRVDPGCEVTLYADGDYRGRSVTLYEDVADLGNTAVGNDSVSSLRIYCRGGGPGRPGGGYDGGYGKPERPRYGVVLYSAPDFRGSSESFEADDPMMGNNSITNYGVGSLSLARGCQVTVYEAHDYRGYSVTFDGDIVSLARTRFGNRQVGSLRLECQRIGGPYPPATVDPPEQRGVTLYDDANYRGRSQTFTASVSDLSRSHVGNDRASSIRVSRGCRAILFSNSDYGGRVAVIEYDQPNLGNTPVGNDSVSSLQVECRGWR